MWGGPGRGPPRGGPPFRGDHQGAMFGGRDRPMPGYRGRDGMNMGPMGPMGPRPQDLHPMDRRRMDGPPMRGPDMDPRDMRGREPNRDFFRPEDEPNFNLRREFEMSNRDRQMNTSGFPGPGRNLGDMGGRNMPPWEPNNRFMDMRDRESFHHDMPRFNRPNIEERRGFSMDRMEQNDGFRDMHDRRPMGFDGDRYDMDLPPCERRMMDTDRRGGPPFNPRERFDSDTDFRNHPGPSVEFKERDRSPVRFGRSDVPLADRERLGMPPDVVGPPRSALLEDDGKKREYPGSGGSPVMDYRSGEEMTLAEEWKNRRKDPFLDKSMGGETEPNFPVHFGSGVNVRDTLPFHDRDKPSFQGKDASFTPSQRFPAMDLPPLGSKGAQDHLLPEMSPLTGQSDRENKQWLGERDPKFIQNRQHRDQRSPYRQGKNEPSHEIQAPADSFKEIKDVTRDQIPTGDGLGDEHEFQGSSTLQARDQDYRDIDYRTGSGRVFDYKHKDLQPPESLLKDSKPIIPSKFTDSGSQDQDYRNASVKNKASNIISITGIPKTTTVDQILSAFAVRDGVPMQGIKIQNAVPGYSHDMAYVEFLDLEDAVHFMESNKGSLKLGTETASMKYVQPDECERVVHESDHKVPKPQDSQLPRSDEPLEELLGSNQKHPVDHQSHGQWQRNSDLTPEAWQQQVDQQLQEELETDQAESVNSQDSHYGSNKSRSVFTESKTMIIKNVKATTTIESILKALDPFAYLDERNVRLVKGKPPGSKCFCFVDMDSHEQVTRLVELLTKPKPLYIDGVRVHAEVARPLKNPNLRRDYDKSNAFMSGHPSEAGMILLQPYPQRLHYLPTLLHPASSSPAMVVAMPGNLMTGCIHPALPSDPSLSQGVDFGETPAAAPGYQTGGLHVSPDSAGITTTTDGSQTNVYGSEIPDTSNYLYDATSGFFYDPETTLYFDPNSRYFYNAQTQEYLYWDAASKTYTPVPGGSSAETHLTTTMTPEDQAILSNPAADAPLEMKKPSDPPQAAAAAGPVSDSANGSAESVPTSAVAPDKKEDEESPKKDKEKDNKEDKPRSLAAVKIMKDMERWAKIQNRQKEVRAPSPVLRTEMEAERRQSKSADAAFAIFERKISGSEDLFKKPLAPGKKDEKSKRPMGSLGLLASDYGAGSDEEVEDEDKEEANKSTQNSQPEEKEDKLTDWKKMACLLCRRQFPNKDALIRHQQLSDLHKQNMEIHLKIKRSKKELEALENQEKELNARETSRSPEQKRRKHHHHQSHQNTWAGSSREVNKGSERPGLGAEPVQQQKKKESVVWDHNTYKQAVRKAMFARFKELE